MEALFFCGVPVGCVLVYGLVHDAKRQARELKRDQQGWRDYATARGYHYTTTSTSYPHRVNHRVDGKIDGLTLSCTTGVGILRMPTTMITVRTDVPVDGRLYVSCDEGLSRAQDDALARRVEIDDPDFNGPIFGVKATHPDLAAVVLVPRVRHILLRMNDGRASLNFRCERELVAVEWMGNEPLPALLDLGFDLLVAACLARTKSGAYR